MRRNRRWLKRLLVTALLLLIASAFAWKLFFNLSFSSAFSHEYSRAEAIVNYKTNEEKFDELVAFFRKNLPAGKEVSIGLGKSKDEFDLGIWSRYSENPIQFGAVNIELGSYRSDSVLIGIGWTNQTIETIMQLLRETECRNISSGNRIQIDLSRSGWCGFSYMIYEMEIPDSVKKDWDYAADSFLRKDVLLVSACAL